jgi:hypothetical protein
LICAVGHVEAPKGLISAAMSTKITAGFMDTLNARSRPRLCKNVFEQLWWPDLELKSHAYANPSSAD